MKIKITMGAIVLLDIKILEVEPTSHVVVLEDSDFDEDEEDDRRRLRGEE